MQISVHYKFLLALVVATFCMMSPAAAAEDAAAATGGLRGRRELGDVLTDAEHGMCEWLCVEFGPHFCSDYLHYYFPFCKDLQN